MGNYLGQRVLGQGKYKMGGENNRKKIYRAQSVKVEFTDNTAVTSVSF